MTGIDIDIRPKLDALQALNLSEEDFHGALERALDDLVGIPQHRLPTPWNIPMQLKGEAFLLGDLARIDVNRSPVQSRAP
jgi:hypothetical protein